MQLQITIPDEHVARLERLAKAEGSATVEECVSKIVARPRSVHPNPPEDRNASIDWETPVELLTREQWQARFDDTLKRQSSRNPQFDESRDSIYE